MRKSRRLALCGLVSAIALIIMLVGNLIGIGTYASPMLSGLILTVIGMSAGKKYQLLSVIAVGLLSLMLLSDWEEILLFIGLLGWYPMAWEYLLKLPKVPRIIVKLVGFNLIIVGLETLVMKVLMPSAETPLMLVILLILANILFILYDFLVPRIMIKLHRKLSRFL